MKKVFFCMTMLMLYGLASAVAKFVDPNILYYGTQAGTSADPYGGSTGLKKATDSIPTVDTIFCRNGTFDMTKHRSIVYNNLTGGVFVSGDTLVDSSRTGTATVYTNTGGTTLLVCVTSGTFATTDVIKNNAGTVRATINGSPTYPGIVITTAGLNSDIPRIIGVKSDWTYNIDTVSTVNGGGLSKTFETATFIFFEVKNIDVCNSSGNGWNRVSGNLSQGNFYNCKFYGNALNGFSDPQWTNFVNCEFSGNQQSGFHGTNANCAFKNSVFKNNHLWGLYCNAAAVYLTNCTVFNNDSVGIQIGQGSRINNCVIDSNRAAGITLGSNNQTTFYIGNCRITRNKTAPINSLGTGNYLVLDNNTIINNGNGNAIAGNPQIMTCGASTTSGVIGYIDSANGVYNLVKTATNRRQQIPVGVIR